MAALAVLAIGCAKEQQPDVQNPADVNAKKTYLRVSVEDTKVAVNPLDGACSWQEGDVLKAYFRVKNADETFADVFVDFTCELKDGEAVFATTQEIPGVYERMILTTPAGEFVDGESDGGKKAGLVRNYVYDPDSVPVYARAYSWEQLPDGSFSAALTHNAAVLKFTLHDIPAYAAGFVLSNKAESVVVTTKFPYKTGYSEDIVLHSVFAHSNAPYCFYLIDGDGDEIEGSRKLFTPQEGYTSVPQVKAGQYIVFDKVVDFKKAELRKDYVKVCGVKWAKGNLVLDKNGAWQTKQAGIDDNFQSGWGLHDQQWKYVNWNKSLYVTVNDTPDYTRHKYTNNVFGDVFTWGGIGRMATYHSGRMVTEDADFDIQAKVWWGYVNQKISGNTTVENTKSNPKNLTLLEGDARFSSTTDGSGNAVYTKDGETKNLAGDIAFWASKGKYCMPNSTQIKNLSNPTSSLASFQYGKYVVDGKTIYGFLYTTPIQKGVVERSVDEVTFSDADLESGLFLPLNGRRSPDSNDNVINQGTQAIYRSSTFGNPGLAEAEGKHEQCARVLWFDGNASPEYGFTSGKPGAVNNPDGYSYTCTLSAAAGGAIRPILYEDPASAE